MTSYEIGSNSSRYPYDYSFVTDGTTGEYTDTTESNFILPVITGADADKFLQVNAQATGYEYTAIDGELPPQAGQTGKFLETNGTSVFWDTVNQVPGVTGGVSGYLLTNNGSTSSWTNGPIGLGTTGAATPMLWFGATNNGFAESWTAGGGATGISAITNGAVCCTFQSGAVRLPGGNPIRSNGNAASRFQFTSDVPNMQNSVTAGTTGTDRNVSVVSTNWNSNSLDSVCSYTQDNPGALVASSMALEIKNNQILFTGAGTNLSTNLPARVTRMTIDNILITTNTCLSAAAGLCLPTSSQASNRTLTQNDNSYQRMNFTNNDVIYTLPALNSGTMFYLNPFANVGSTFGAFVARGTGVSNFETYFNGVREQTTANVRLEAGSIYQCIYFANVSNWHIIRISGITQQLNFTGGSTALPSISFNDPPGVTGNNASGLYGSNDNVTVCTNGTNRLVIGNTGASITGDLTVSGTISGSISTPQVAKRTVVIASNSSAAYVYDSGNTGPATTLISNSIQSQKNITLGNMGQSYDGFEFEFMLTGDLNNFGVAVTLSLAGSFVKVRSGAIGVDGSTAGQVYTFSRPMNEFRITGVFVWNNGTPYWVVIDRGVYKQRATNTKFNGLVGGVAGDFVVDRNTPQEVLLTRENNTTVAFKNLVTYGGSQEDYDGFTFYLSTSSTLTGKVNFKNDTSVDLRVFAPPPPGVTGGTGVQTVISAGGNFDMIDAAKTIFRYWKCIFRDRIAGGHAWHIYELT
jgi:hypothetical protein